MRPLIGATAMPPEVVALLPGLAPEGAVRPAAVADEIRFRAFNLVADLLDDVGRRRPVAVVLDDLHWADPSSLELLRTVARRSGTSHFAVVGTYRDTDVEPEHPLHPLLGELARAGPRVVLTGLGPDEVAQLLEASNARSTADVAAAVAIRTGGNPFFVREIGRAGTDVDDLPPAVRDVLLHRIDLPPLAARRVLEVGGGAGSCRRRLVAAVLDDDPLAVLDERRRAHPPAPARARRDRRADVRPCARARDGAVRAACPPRGRAPRPGRRRHRSAVGSGRGRCHRPSPGAVGAARPGRRGAVGGRGRASGAAPARLRAGGALVRASRRARSAGYAGAGGAPRRPGRCRGPHPDRVSRRGRVGGGGRCGHRPARRRRRAPRSRRDRVRRARSSASSRQDSPSPSRWRWPTRRCSLCRPSRRPLRARLLARVATNLGYTPEHGRALECASQAARGRRERWATTTRWSRRSPR